MTNPISRRTAIAAVGLLAGSAMAQPASGRPITLICPFAAGSTADVQLRALAVGASRILGQPIVVDNRPGAAGTLGPSGLVGVQPDGHLLSMATAVALLRQPFIQKTRYDPARDFTYLIGVTRFEMGLVVRADAPWKTLDDFIRDAKRRPGEIFYGTSGIATAQHSTMLQLGELAGVDWTHVPHRTGVFNGLLGSQVHAVLETSGWAPFVDAGTFRLLAVCGESRLARWPGVPTLKESGYAVAESVPWGIVGPAGMSAPVVLAQHDAFRQAAQEQAFIKVLQTLGQKPWLADSAAYRDYTVARIPVERDLVNKYRLREQ